MKKYTINQLRGAWGAGANHSQGHGNDHLIGSYFHTWDDDGTLNEQGRVLSRHADGYYLVQFYEWFMGEPSSRQLRAFESMVSWTFYDSHEAMDAAYKKYVATSPAWAWSWK